MTDAMDLERRIRHRLRGDFVHYAEKCLSIRPKTGPIESFKLNSVQERLHRAAEDQIKRTGKVRKLILKARQTGVSTYVEGRFYWRTTHQSGTRAFILTHKDEATDNLFEMAKRFHAHCPVVVKPQTTASNAKELKFGLLDSSYRVGTAKAKGVGRSDTIQLFHGSEVAHWPNAEKHAAGVLQAVPDAPGTEIWLESTANGSSGLFYQLCVKAEQNEGEYELVFIPWFEQEGYRKTPPGEWRPSGIWPEYGRVHGLDPQQLFWAYTKNEELAVSTGQTIDEVSWLFKQEYPASASEAFQVSGTHSFIQRETVAVAVAAEFPEPAVDTPLILGVDVAHGGGDRTRLVDRCGRRLGHLVNDTINQSDEMAIAGMLLRRMEKIQPDMVFVDVTGGYGAGLVDRLREQGYGCVRGVNFAARALDPIRYANKRAEMWDGLRQLFAEGADMVADASLVRDITAPTARPDISGRLLLEKKDEIRKRLGLSPDGGDAAALTFAAPVQRKGTAGRAMPESVEADYDLLGH